MPSPQPSWLTLTRPVKVTWIYVLGMTLAPLPFFSSCPLPPVLPAAQQPQVSTSLSHSLVAFVLASQTLSVELLDSLP